MAQAKKAAKKMYVPQAHAYGSHKLARFLGFQSERVMVSYLEHGRDEEGNGEVVQPVAGSSCREKDSSQQVTRTLKCLVV